MVFIARETTKTTPKKTPRKLFDNGDKDSQGTRPRSFVDKKCQVQQLRLQTVARMRNKETIRAVRGESRKKNSMKMEWVGKRRRIRSDGGQQEGGPLSPMRKEKQLIYQGMTKRRKVAQWRDAKLRKSVRNAVMNTVCPRVCSSPTKGAGCCVQTCIYFPSSSTRPKMRGRGLPLLK